ncbi:endoglucanase [Auriculariales sp. MPI-PUGE-AT-0066]|nr:endoglucanase [Auriculariales sp. MPI-PUGE-AT-0066]
MLKLSLLLAAVTSLPLVYAQAPLYGQCGGQGWTGATTCVAGATCTYSNQWYSQCLPSATATSTTATSTTSGTTATGVCGSATKTKLKYFGINQSCAEFGNTAWPGQLGKDYTWPSPSSIDYFVGQGMNTFRVAFLMERVSPPATGLTGAFNATYLQALKDTVNYITNKGSYAILDPHNFLHYNNAPLTNTTLFQAWWQKLAAEFVSNSLVIFDLQNEPDTIAATTVRDVVRSMQAGINGIRAAGASQLILVEGTSWSGAWTWTTSSGNSDAFKAGSITDPKNNFAIEMHQYLDSDGSGTSGTCVSTTIGKERVAAATTWLKNNNYKGFLGEYGGGANSVCETAIQGMLCDLQTSGVWLGALFWAAGPWWGTYFQSMEPPSGAALPILPYIQAALA